jgi:hypothetical protein
MIPPILHFIWITLDKPFPELYRQTLKCAVKNTNFKIILHTDHPNLEIPDIEIRNRVFTKTYNNHTYVPGTDMMAHLVDIARLEILYEEGGIYSDLDVFWLKNPWHLLHHRAFIGFDNKSYKILCNAVIGSEKDHPAILAYKNWCIENYPAKKWWSLANPYKVWKDRTDVTFLDKKEFFPVRWTKMNNVQFSQVSQSTAIHLYKSFDLEFGGEFFEHLFNYLS